MNKLIVTSVAFLVAVFVFSDGFSQSIGGNEKGNVLSSLKPVPSVVNETDNPNDLLVVYDALGLKAVPAFDPEKINNSIYNRGILKAELALDFEGNGVSTLRNEIKSNEEVDFREMAVPALDAGNVLNVREQNSPREMASPAK